jgi:hypothetical protein
MPDYTITAEKLQELNVLVNEGGNVPTKTNKATGETARLLDLNDVAGAKVSNLAASKANDENTPAWENIQKWHDSVRDGVVEPPVPPVVTPPNNGLLPPYTPGQGVALTQMSANQVVSFQSTTDGRNASYQVGASANAWCRIGVSDIPNTWVAGQYIVMMFTQQSGLQEIRYSIQPL